MTKLPRRIAAIITALVLFLGSHATVLADDLDGANAAYFGGDYEMASRLFKPLPHKGMPRPRTASASCTP